MWEVEIQGLVSGALQDMTLYAKTVAIPQSAVEQIIINHKAGKTHHAGRDAAAHTVIVTFWDDEAQTIHKFMHDWFDLIHNPLTSSGVSRDIYQANMIIKLMDTADETVTSTISLGHVFPIDIAEATLSYDASEPIEHSITFSYDEKEIS